MERIHCKTEDDTLDEFSKEKKMSMWHRSKNMMAEVATRERKDGEKPVWNGFDMCQTALELYSYETASWYSSKIHKEKMKPQKKKGKIIAFHI